jgi:uncharacterized protein (TIGR02145 family)
MKRLSIFVVLGIILSQSLAQVPQKFSYQAAIRYNDGTTIANEDVDIKISLRKVALDGDIVYSENHVVSTNPQGIVSLSIGTGTILSGNFIEIPWNETIFIQVDFRLAEEKVDYTTLGVTQILSVPYALYAGNAIQGEGVNGQIATFDGDSWSGTRQVSLSNNTVEVLAMEGRNLDEPIFTVKNSNNEVVFAVYESGVTINIGEQTGGEKSNKAGFAIGGLTGPKTTNNYLTILPDSVRFNLVENSDQDPEKTNKAGFAIGGLTGGKELTHNYLTLKSDTVRFIISNPPSKTNKAGFAIGGLTGPKTEVIDLLSVNVDTTTIYTTLQATGDINVVGNLYTGGSLSTQVIYNGYSYQTVTIGEQTWFKENLRTLYYQSGTEQINPINDVFVYNLQEMSHPNVSNYGLLYSRFATVESAMGICPADWHVPNQQDWEQLFWWLGGETWYDNLDLVAIRMMEVGFWDAAPGTLTPNNLSGYSARPSGRGTKGIPNPTFSDIEQKAYIWSSGDGMGIPSGYIIISKLEGQGIVQVPVDDLTGNELLPVRCVKNNW